MHAEHRGEQRQGGAAGPDEPRTLGRGRRLRRPQEFAAVLAADRSLSIRAAGRWLSMTAAPIPVAPGGARLGITVSKRMARRAIDRALVKRIVRESFRHAAGRIERDAVAAGVRVDISVRLRRAVALPGDPQRPSLPAWRRALRIEADTLLASLAFRAASVPTDA